MLHGLASEPVLFPLVLGETLIGRLNFLDLVLDSPAVSRVHAKIVREAFGFVLIDLESTVGTKVNGASIHRHTLVTGDVIEIAGFRLEFEG